MPQFLLLLGSNTSPRFVFIQRALQLLHESQIVVQQLSPFYETAPWGKTDQSHFLNVAAQVTTSLHSIELLKCLKEAEQKLGRTSTEKWGPREIDLDILFCGNEILHSETLVIPHPELHQRRFALVPLNDLVPEYVHPVFKKTVSKLLQHCADKGEVRYYCEGDFQSKAVTVKGKVQGVAFRYYTQEAANKYGMKGWVKNQADGSVYCEAEGSADSMKSFISFCKEGSPTSRVDVVEVVDREPGFFKTFEVRT